ncbi:secreted RxLR effector protein 161-like [Rutidosis leptorrhynchoides]|uniref:secreted RxLR effector protein 161-like n=1 Tax=Rutidosis leptorrhynchoides TaxID=125765 RepID=UPI003A99FA27
MSTLMDLSGKLMSNQSEAVSQLEYSQVIDCLMYVMTYTRSDIAYAVVKLSRYTSNPITHHWQEIRRVLKSFFNKWLGVLTRVGAISWAVKKQTCITNSMMESEFVPLVPAGKEAEWLRILIHDIHLWPKPIIPMFIHCDSAKTLAKAYSQMYNGPMGSLDI